VKRSLLVLALGILCACNEAVPENLVLITVDTLRADRLGAYGYSRARTPRIDGLARESLRFERAYSHSSSTLPSVASLMTGLRPAQHRRLTNLGSLRPDVATLATRLHEEGFATGAFIGSYVLRPRHGTALGFDRYTRSYGAREKNRDQPENRAGRLTDEAIAWLDELPAGKRFLLWIHYQEPHGPYTPLRFASVEASGPRLPRSETQSGRGAIPRYQWLGHGLLRVYESRYDGEIAEVDRNVGRLLAALRERGLLDRSVVAFTSDHGEAFGEDGLYCAHGEGLSEALLHVPLLLRAPGVVRGVRRDAVRLIDVAPTVLDLLGVAYEALPGSSLLEYLGDRRLVAQVNIRNGLAWRSLRENVFELSEDLAGSAIRPLDPDASTAEPLLAQRRELEASLERLAPWTRSGDPLQLSPEEVEGLRAMGYLE
jgi:arylsulfatase A-like enzyme